MKCLHIDQLLIHFPFAFSHFLLCISDHLLCNIFLLFSWFLVALWIFNYFELTWMLLKGPKKTFRTARVWWCGVSHGNSVYLGKLCWEYVCLVCIKSSQLINRLTQLLWNGIWRDNANKWGTKINQNIRHKLEAVFPIN